MQNFKYNQNKFPKPLSQFTVLMLLAIALVPYGWAAQYSATAYFVVNYLLGGAAVHIVGHFLLFVLLGTAVFATLPRLHSHPLLYFGLMLLIGITQEYLQLVTFKQRPLSFDDVFDLIVDLLGAAAALGLIRRFRKIRQNDKKLKANS